MTLIGKTSEGLPGDRVRWYLDIPVSNVVLVKIRQGLEDWQHNRRNDRLRQTLANAEENELMQSEV